MSKSRLLLMILVFFVLLIGLVIKLIDIQIIKRDELKYFADRLHLKEETILPERGLIYDRNNILLAYNRSDYSLYVDKRQTSSRTRDSIALKLSHIFGKPSSYFKSLLRNPKNIVCIDKKAPGDKIQYIQSSKEPGMFWEANPTRIYQYHNLASHLIGYVDAGFQGRNGIEQFFNSSLKGIEGKRVIERDGNGDITNIAEGETMPATSGNSIVLTINKNMQSILEEELREGLKTYGGSTALGIIADPNTGEILALANENDFDPNNFNEYSDDVRRNRIVTDSYEPGSTFKAVTLSALIDQNLVKLNENIFVENGKFVFNNTPIRDTHNHDWLTVRGIFEQSSNIGFAKLIQRMDDESFYKYLRAFGFGGFTSIELPSESRGRLKMPTHWDKLTKAFMAFGYQVAVTPVQLLMAYCAIVNGGILYQPSLVKKEISPAGVVLYESSPKEVRRVISEKTSSLMRDLMKGVVENGTGTNAKSDFLSIGGKTGTSQQLEDGSYSKKNYNSSFAGFFPVDNPRLVCLIIVDSPELGKYGGLVAAPVFKKTIERIVQFNPDEFQRPRNTDEVKDDIKIIYAKDPAVQNEPVKYEKFVTSAGVMPDLTKNSVREAVRLLTKLGLKYRIKGSGKIIQQSILPGEPLRKNSVCELTCEISDSKKVSVY